MTGRRFAFLICSERSGSNLITGLMNGHPAISAPPPSHLFRLFVTNAANYGDLARDENWQVLLGDVADAFDAQLGSWNTRLGRDGLAALGLERSAVAPVAALYETEAAHDGASLVFVKENHTARFAADLAAAVPGCRFVYLVRDPRDVAASYLATDGIPGGVARAVEVWSADQADAAALRARPGMAGLVHALRYEDLLADTPGELARIAGFLGLPYEARMLEFHRDPRTRRNAARIDAWKNLSRPVQAGNLGKFRTGLTPDEIEYVELGCGAAMRALGYRPEIVTDPPDAAQAARRIEALRPALRAGSYRVGTGGEFETRRRRLEVIETVRSRRLG